MKWLKSLILCLLFVGSVAQLSLAASGAELDQLMLEFENYMLHYDDLIKDLEEQLQQTERLFQSQNPGFGAWMGGRVELDWRDNSAGSVTFGNPRFVAEMAMRTRLSSSFNSNLTFTLYQNPYGGNPSTSISKLSLDGSIRLGQQAVSITAGDLDLYFSPLTMGRNRRILDESDFVSSWRFQGVRLNTKFRSIGIMPWIARTRRGVGSNYDQLFMGLRSSFDITPNTNAQILYYQLADNLRSGPPTNKAVKSSLFGVGFQNKFHTSFLEGNLSGELNWSFDDSNIFAAADPIRDQAILLSSNLSTSLGSFKLPLAVRYLAIGPNYPRSRTAGTGYTAVINLPDDYIYQPEDDPYQYDYYRNRAGWQAKVGPVNLGPLEVSYLQEDYHEILPLAENLQARSFLHNKAEAAWNFKNLLGAETKILVWHGGYSTIRQGEDQLGIDVGAGDVGYGFWRKLSGRTQIELTRTLYPKAGKFQGTVYEEQTVRNRLRIWHTIDQINISGDFRFDRLEGSADSFGLLKGRVELDTPLGSNKLQLIGEFERKDGEQMPEPSWSTRLFVKNSISF